MTKPPRIPDEYRFVHAFALAVEPGDTLANEHSNWCPAGEHQEKRGNEP